MADSEGLASPGEPGDDSWFPITLQWLLRVLLPVIVSLGPKVLFLWLRDQLAWSTIIRGPEVMTLPLTLSMAALIDLFAKLLPVSFRLWRVWAFSAVATFALLFLISLMLRVIYGWLHSGLIASPPELIAVERAELAGVALSVLLVILSLIAAIAEKRKGIDRTEQSC